MFAIQSEVGQCFFGQEFAHIYHTKQTGSNFWFCQHFIIWANLFNTKNLIIFAIRSKLAQYQEFASNYQPIQISSILRVWSCLLIQVNTPKLRFWAHLQRFVSMLVIISLHVFTSEANVTQKRRSAHKFASCVNRHQINTFISTFPRGQIKRKFIAAQYFCTTVEIFNKCGIYHLCYG